MINQVLHPSVTRWMLALVAASVMAFAPSTALAQQTLPNFDPSAFLDGHTVNCANFASQAQAQAVLRADPSDPNRLDRDGDGIACEGNRAPRDLIAVPRDFNPRDWVVTGQDLYTCADFLSQAEAQAVLRVDPRDLNRLDTNRNGVACEDDLRPPFSRYPVPR